MAVSFLFRIILLAISSLFVYRYRFRLMNIIFAQPWLRRMMVRTFMRFPYVRSLMANQMFRY